MSETLCTLRTKGGGGGELPYIDFNNLIYSDSKIRVSSMTYTTTEDCYVWCQPRMWHGGTTCTITLNGTVVAKPQVSASSSSPVEYGQIYMFVTLARKGDTITMAFSSTNYNGTNYLYAYGFSDTVVANPNV